MMKRADRSSLSLRHARQGQALVEFAIVAFALYLILAALLTFGRAIFAAQVLQQTADVFARELSRAPLPPGETLQTLFRPANTAPPLTADSADPPFTPAEISVRNTLFDEKALDIDITAWQNNDQGLTLMQYLEQQQVPLINRMLVPLMIIDPRNDGYHLWYPGATLKDGHYFVYTLRGTTLQEFPVIDWLPGNADQPRTAADPFALALSPDGTTTVGGLSQIRINYPFQSASLSLFHYNYPAGGPQHGIPVGVPGASGTYDTVNEAPDTGSTRGGLYGGDHHLGQQFIAGMTVRPFQRMISAQAVYRREAFSP